MENLPDGSQDHQLNFGSGGASLIVVHPQGKKPRFVLTIGMFNREGELSQLSSKELEDAINRVNTLRKLVSDKVKTLLHR